MNQKRALIKPVTPYWSPYTDVYTKKETLIDSHDMKVFQSEVLKQKELQDFPGISYIRTYIRTVVFYIKTDYFSVIINLTKLYYNHITCSQAYKFFKWIKCMKKNKKV